MPIPPGGYIATLADSGIGHYTPTVKPLQPITAIPNPIHIKHTQFPVMLYHEVRSMADRTAYHLNISGMYCVQCEHRIAKALQNMKGVHNVSVSYKKSKGRF